MSKQEPLVTVGQLVKKLGVPRPFMRKILQQLNKEGILESYKGQGGGFKLKISPKKIYMVEIMRVFQGPVGLNGCFLKKDVCPNKGKCVLRRKIRSIEEGVLGQLREITIASLVKG